MFGDFYQFDAITKNVFLRMLNFACHLTNAEYKIQYKYYE